MLTQNSLSVRRYDLDWLRVLAFGLLIFYHTGMFFVTWGWHIKNNVIAEWMQIPMLFLNQWRMSLLFIISGAATYLALDKLPAGKFTWERTKRIFIPLVFGMFVIIPPQIYFERISNGKTFSYLEFYPSILHFIPYPKGNFSWHHLWYLAYLFVYSLVFLPLFIWLRSESGKKVTSFMAGIASIPFMIYAFAIVQFLAEGALRDRWEPTNNLIADWYNHALYTGFFIAGFVICTNEKFWQAIERQRFWSLGLGLVTIVVLYSVYWLNWKDIDGLEIAVYRAVKSLNRWFWLLTILGFGKYYLNFNAPFLKYSTDAVYPFYILHQTVIIFIAYFATNWQWSVGIKFLYIAAATFLVCWILYEFLIKRFQLTRLLFGMKLKPFRQKEPVLEEA
jgi:peptidoglycan/LPS O-acetylase OafA/YrhL